MTSRLIYVVGASGSGKDSLMRYAREQLAGDPSVLFAHRYITRPADVGGENHVALSAREFTARDAARLFALRWHSHGHAYGVGIEINEWLARGATVVVNGSREYLPEARHHYPELLAVWIEVPTEVLRERLVRRGRENAEAVAARLARHGALQATPREGVLIHNDGPLADAGEALVAAIVQRMRPQRCA